MENLSAALNLLANSKSVNYFHSEVAKKVPTCLWRTPHHHEKKQANSLYTFTVEKKII